MNSSRTIIVLIKNRFKSLSLFEFESQLPNDEIRQNVLKAMESSWNYVMEVNVDVDETYVGGQDDEAIGRNEGTKKIIMVVAVERMAKGISRM